MRRLFASDSKMMIYLSKVLDLIVLNLLFLVCCIPVITTGAALCAMYYTVVKVVRRGHGYVFREFVHSIKENFWQATAAWLLFCAGGGIIAFGLVMVINYMKSIPGAVIIALYLTAALLLLGIVVYLFPVLSRFTVKFKELFQMSLYLSASHRKTTALQIVLAILFIYLIWFGWMAVPLLLFIVPSLIVLLMSFGMEKVLQVYTSEEQVQEGEDGERIPWYLQNGGKVDE